MNKWLAFLTIINGAIIGMLITLIVVGKQSVGSYQEMTFHDALYLFLQCLLLLVAALTVSEMLSSSKNQKEQWLHDTFIKHEAEVLIEIKKKLFEYGPAIDFVKRQYFQVQRYGYDEDQLEYLEKKKAEGLSIDSLVIKENYNKLCTLNRFFVSNKNVIMKNNLIDGVKRINMLMQILHSFVQREEHKYVLFDESQPPRVLTYKLSYWIELIRAFNMQMSNYKQTDFFAGENKSIEEYEGDFIKSRDKFFSVIDDLVDKVDKLTIHGSDDSESGNYVFLANYPKIG